MYRSDLKARDRSGDVVAVAAIHAALLLAFLNLAGKMPLPATETVFRVVNFNQPKPPPPPPPPAQSKPKEKQGGAAPANIRSQATPIAAPKPRVVVPPRPQIAASPTPRQGASPTQGASNVLGPGTGAGGVGTGTGTG